MKAFWVFVGGMVAVSFLVWCLLTYGLISDEERIQRLIEQGSRGVESGSLFVLSNLLAADYQHEGGLGKAEVLGALRSLFENTRNRRVHVLRCLEKVEKNRADSEVTFWFSAQSQLSPAIPQEWLDLTGREKQTVHLNLVKEGRSWKITRSALRRAR